MTAQTSSRLRLAAASVVLLSVGVAGGLAISHLKPAAPADTPGAEDRKVLYWYDPMVPAQRFDKAGKSPFMDMQLVPKYAGDADAATGVQIDPGRLQNLGVRLVTVQQGMLASDLTTTGVVDFNQRDLTIVQARTGGFVQRVYARAPGDIVAAGAPLADILVPEWSGAQAEYLAVRRAGDKALTQAARQRLTLLGIP